MARTLSQRFTLSLAMTAAMTLSGCIVSGGGGHQQNPQPVPVYPGCAALQGSGASGVIGMTAVRGNYASFESYINPDFYMRHYQGLGEISRITNRSSDRDKDDATFRVVPGLADERCISFEASNYPGYFLRHANGEIVLTAGNSDLLFREDATFCPRPGLADAHELSFESCNYPDFYLNADERDHGLYLDDGVGRDFEEDATFLLMDPW